MMLHYMEICEWPRKHIDSFTLFYFNLEINEMCSQTHRERILLAYQARVRRQWHEDLMRQKGFNITIINQKLLSSVAEEVWDSICTESIKQVSDILTSSSSFCQLTNTLPSFTSHFVYATSAYLHPCQHKHMPCHAMPNANATSLHTF